MSAKGPPPAPPKPGGKAAPPPPTKPTAATSSPPPSKPAPPAKPTASPASKPAPPAPAAKPAPAPAAKPAPAPAAKPAPAPAAKPAPAPAAKPAPAPAAKASPPPASKPAAGGGFKPAAKSAAAAPAAKKPAAAASGPARKGPGSSASAGDKKATSDFLTELPRFEIEEMVLDMKGVDVYIDITLGTPQIIARMIEVITCAGDRLSDDDKIMADLAEYATDIIWKRVNQTVIDEGERNALLAKVDKIRSAIPRSKVTCNSSCKYCQGSGFFHNGDYNQEWDEYECCQKKAACTPCTQQARSACSAVFRGDDGSERPLY